MQKHVNLVDLVKSFPTNTYLQNLASIQPRTSPRKFAHLAEKSENGSISNLSTKVSAAVSAAVTGTLPEEFLREVLGFFAIFLLVGLLVGGQFCLDSSGRTDTDQ